MASARRSDERMMSRGWASASCVRGIPSRNAKTPAMYSRMRVIFVSTPFAASSRPMRHRIARTNVPKPANAHHDATSTIWLISAGASTRIGGPQYPVPRDT